MDEIYSRLVAKGTLYSIENYLEKFFINIFRSFYTDCSYDEFKNFAIPEDYVWFMEKTGNLGIAFYEIDQYIYGLYQMIYDTIYEMKWNGNKENKPVFWLYVGHRNDRGFFFICCDKRHEYYGQVCEFYDGSPFLDMNDGIELGDFKTFCNAVLNGEASIKLKTIQMGYWCTLHLFDEKKFYKEIVPTLKGETGDLTADCQEFLKSHVIGGTARLSKHELEKLVNETIKNIVSISNSLDKSFRINTEYQKVQKYDAQLAFFDTLEGYYDFCKFFEYYIFKTCADFFPHLPLGKGRVMRNFDISVKALSDSILGELDNWNDFFCYYGTGITNWMSYEDLQYLYLDKENLKYEDSERAKFFLSLLEVAHSNQLGFITGVDMNEDILELLPNNKTVKSETWTLENSSELLWKR